jgi:hypothetical protein
LSDFGLYLSDFGLYLSGFGASTPFLPQFTPKNPLAEAIHRKPRWQILLPTQVTESSPGKYCFLKATGN